MGPVVECMRDQEASQPNLRIQRLFFLSYEVARSVNITAELLPIERTVLLVEVSELTIASNLLVDRISKASNRSGSNQH